MSSICASDVVRFTEGECHVFAQALNDITGWPIYCFAQRQRKPITHAFVMHPSGRPVDIEGIHDMKEFKKRWKRRAMREFTREELAEFDWVRNYFGSYSNKRASQLAPIIVDALDKRDDL